MKNTLLPLMFASFLTVTGTTLAEPAATGQAAAGNCEAHALTKDGKPLAGAAKAAFIKKCEKDNAAPAGTPAASINSGCEARAVGKNGKPLAGAAKATFIKKCEKDAKAG